MTGFCANCGAKLATPFCAMCGASSGVTAGSQSSTSALSYGTATAIPIQQTAVDPRLPGASFIGQWNWGAAFLTPYWLMTHRNPTLGVIILICGFIPGVQVLEIGVLIYYGINGNRVAALCGRYTSEAEFVAVQNAWRNWAFGMAIATSALSILLFILNVITAGMYQSQY